MPKQNPFIKIPESSEAPQAEGASDPIGPKPLVNENDKEQQDGDPALIIDELRHEIRELEGKNNKVTEKNEKLKDDLEKMTLRANTHTIKSQRMRVFCELFNGMAAKGAFQPFHATSNPTGIKSEAEVDKLVAHCAGIAERAVKIVDERFAK